MLEFQTDATPDPYPDQNPIPNGQDLPKDLDIFYRAEQDFLPEGKTFKDLTPEQMRVLQSQYRFSAYRPGLYQGVTGFGCMLS